MDLSLENRVAFVTGAARGIGRAIALELARNGADVAVADVRIAKYTGERYYRLSRRVSGVEEDVPTAEAVAELGRRAIAVEVDIADANKVRDAIERAANELGAVDVLVNNAGIVNNIGTIADMPRESWDREIAVNLSGGFSCIQAVLPGMTSRGWGRIVNISSIAAETPSPFQPAYAASKAAVIAMTKTVAKTYAAAGVTCNAVLPGLIATPLALSMPPEVRDRMLRMVPTRRLGELQEIAAVVAFLASPAASFVNGAAIPVDGGWLTGPTEV